MAAVLTEPPVKSQEEDKISLSKEVQHSVTKLRELLLVGASAAGEALHCACGNCGPYTNYEAGLLMNDLVDLSQMISDSVCPQKFNKKGRHLYSTSSYWWTEGGSTLATIILHFIIPTYKRNGEKNKIWKESQIRYYSQKYLKWVMEPLFFVGTDPDNNDKMFTITLSQASAMFTLHEASGNDVDMPHALPFNVENFYYIESPGEWTLRDGELSRGNQGKRSGVEIIAPTPDADKIVYLDDQDGSWKEEKFNQGKIKFSKSRSLTFVVQDAEGKEVTTQNSTRSCHIAFPGIYQIGEGDELEDLTEMEVTEMD